MFRGAPGAGNGYPSVRGFRERHSVFLRLAHTHPTGNAFSHIWRMGSVPNQTNTLHLYAAKVPSVSRFFNVISTPLAAISAPVPLSPATRSVFSHLPRTTVRTWSAVVGALSYDCEGEACYFWTMPAFWNCPSTQIAALGNVAGTTATFSHVGGQPGRWHIRARDAFGQPSPWSPWFDFLYTG